MEPQEKKHKLLKPLLIILLGIVLVGATGFGVWYWQGTVATKQKSSSNQKIRDLEKELADLKKSGTPIANTGKDSAQTSPTTAPRQNTKVSPAATAASTTTPDPNNISNLTSSISGQSYTLTWDEPPSPNFAKIIILRFRTFGNTLYGSRDEEYGEVLTGVKTWTDTKADCDQCGTTYIFTLVDSAGNTVGNNSINVRTPKYFCHATDPTCNPTINNLSNP